MEGPGLKFYKKKKRKMIKKNGAKQEDNKKNLLYILPESMREMWILVPTRNPDSQLYFEANSKNESK